jgi:hypothetical protein
MSSEDHQNASEDTEYTGKRYYGKYRGKVVFNNDPLFKGRIRALVPSVTAFVPSTWIEPASPFAGLGVGLFVVPPMNASVWVEFIEGHPSYPIWTGGYWDEKDLAVIVPPTSRPFVKPNQFKIRTLGTTITMDDLPIPNITLETYDGQKIVINSAGIQIGFGLPGADMIVKGITIDKAGNVVINGTNISIISTGGTVII